MGREIFSHTDTDGDRVDVRRRSGYEGEVYVSSPGAYAPGEALRDALIAAFPLPAPKDEEPDPAAAIDEPLAFWERELLGTVTPTERVAETVAEALAKAEKAAQEAAAKVYLQTLSEALSAAYAEAHPAPLPGHGLAIGARVRVNAPRVYLGAAATRGTGTIVGVAHADRGDWRVSLDASGETLGYAAQELTRIEPTS